MCQHNDQLPIIFFKTETLFDPISEFPDQEMVTVLHMEQYRIKTSGIYKQKQVAPMKYGWTTVKA
jgi:hypothetical protein